MHVKQSWILLMFAMCGCPEIKAQDNSTVGATNLTMTTEAPPSCAGRCHETYIPGLACYCNEACDQYENCCFDYYDVCTDSCAGRCEESYMPGLGCYCNEACDQYENCCSDYYDVCVAKSSESSCSGRCDETYIPGLECYCNEACDQYENCCSDYYAICAADSIWSDEWMTFKQHVYKSFTDNTITYHRAAEECAKLGTKLVSINSIEENDFIMEKVLKKRTFVAFIGASDAANEGEWLWVDGSRMPLPTDTWHEWYPGQPDNTDQQQHCAILTNYKFWDVQRYTIDRYEWMDYSCEVNYENQVTGYICEGSTKCDPNPCANDGKCQYVGLQDEVNEEIECICRGNFVGDRCQYEMIEGESWTLCGDTNLTSSSGEVISPLYPKHYPNNVKCEWTITVNEGDTIALQMLRFDLEPTKHCIFDSLSIYDGASNETVLLDKVCGSLGDNAVLENQLMSVSNQVRIVFTTDDSSRFTGFKLKYKQDKCGMGIGNSGCGTPRTFTSQCGDIDIKQGPGEDSPCHWLIDVGRDNIVNLTARLFDTPDSGIDCASGHLSVHDGPNADAPLLGKYCGRRLPWQLISTASQLYMFMEGAWTSENRVLFNYQALAKEDYNERSQTHILSGSLGSFTSSQSPINVIARDVEIQRWLVKVPIGDLIELQIRQRLANGSVLEIFDGYSEESKMLYRSEGSSSDLEETTTVKGSSFQTLVTLSKYRNDPVSSVEIEYKRKDWIPKLSGCYRPKFYHSQNEEGVENGIVRADEPAMIMVSDKSYAPANAGYDSGLYCKWLVEGESSLNFQFLDTNIHPLTENCDYDGFVIYEGNSTSDRRFGPYCGTQTFLPAEIGTTTKQLLLVFYSDTRGPRRADGILRGMVSTQGDCPIQQMTEPIGETLTTPCGIILGPRLPGLVPSGVYSWQLDSGLAGSYYEMTVHYVQGPAQSQDPNCMQHLSILEIGTFSGARRQGFIHLMKLCGDTNLFVPGRPIRNAPYLTPIIELNTASMGIPQRWHFKISYKNKAMEKPKNIIPPEQLSCPPSYHYYNGQCYRYYEWVLRHYYTEEYEWQLRWQSALQQCERENATLVSIYDEDESYFLKYMMAHDWYWDGTYQSSHRHIFIGLNNKDGEYKWTDGTKLSYADWLKPKESWEQPLFLEETLQSGLISDKDPQPNADVGSLCTTMVVVNPWDSNNWAKIPCDYPVFDAGVICKKVADGIPDEKTAITVSKEFPKIEKVCPPGYTMIGGGCLSLVTDYDIVRSAAHHQKQVSVAGVHYATAQSLCVQNSGEIASMETIDFGRLENYLRLWRHTEVTGNVWTKSNLIGKECTIIKPSRPQRQSDNIMYSVERLPCSHEQVVTSRSVLCVAQTIDLVEDCSKEEFTCANGMCISADSVCDGINDCADDSDEIECGCGKSMFECDNGACIPVNLYCDFIDNCGDNSDEATCVLEECSSDEFRCDNGQCIPSHLTCNFVLDCVDGSDETAQTCENQCSGLQCFSGKCLEPSLGKDLISDCPGVSLEDEIDTGIENTYTILDVYKYQNTGNATDNVIGCESQDEVQCREGHPRCFQRAQSCIYDTYLVDEGKEMQVQTGCRDGAHLRNFCGEAECPGMFHCPGSVCLPVRKVCDGARDCPGGEDENHCEEYTCPGFFKCKGESFCIRHEEVCDGKVQCRQYGEDEKYCNVTEPLCFENNCTCNGHSVNCEAAGLTILPNTTSLVTRTPRALLLANNSIRLETTSFAKMFWLARLFLKNNKIDYVPFGVFDGLKNLLELDLSSNAIRTFVPGTFRDLVSLKMLDLSGNSLIDLQRDLLADLNSIIHLRIEDNSKLQEVSLDAFEDVPTLEVLNSDAFKFCCLAKQAKECTPIGDEFSNCEDLMANYPLQISIWVLGIVALVGNVFVVAWRLKTDRNKVASFYIINLGASDCLMGIYLLIIGSVDVLYRGRYIVYADTWRSSALCQFAGFLAMLSSEVSVFMLTAITVDRAMAIMFPLKSKSFRMKHGRIVALTGWGICLLLTILPTTKVSYFGDAFFGRTGVCLPFQVTNEKLPGWEYSVFIFLVVNLISFIVILTGYVLLYLSVKTSIKQMGNSSTSTTDEYALAKKLAIVIVTDFLCWVPIILIGLAALAGARISPQVSAWIAVFILPLNSALNPLLYTISNMECRKKKKPSGVSKGTASTALSSQSNVGRMKMSVKKVIRVNSKREILDNGKQPVSEEKEVNDKNVTTNGVMMTEGKDNDGYEASDNRV